MRPTIINAHLGENENQLLLFINFCFLQSTKIDKYSSIGAAFADRLTKRGYEIAGYQPASSFSGNRPDKDGGYAFLIYEDSCKSEEQLLKDVDQLIWNY